MANFNTPYEIEREGQMEFFDNYGIPYNDDASVLVDNTDGIYNGNIFEFKLNISNLNKTLFQTIKYLSRMRIKGESVPATILLVDLNTTTVYVYKSKDYFDAIHKIYTGAASKDNEGFVAGNYDLMLDYSDMAQSAQVKKILKGRKVNPDEMYIPINIDENCIVGWAERYYREKPKASKGDFLGDDTGTAVRITGEIREPKHFRGLINPYIGKTNEKFKYLMDCLNDRLSKKDLGAFYTPLPYAKKAAELVQMAVDRVPEGNDYIILDRCAGTGNLEAALIGLFDRNGDELIEHCVVSTYEYYEYKVLSERIGDLVRDIIPPTEANVEYENGKVANADAMSREYIENSTIRKYVDDPNCTIILFENPPYSDTSAATFTEKTGSNQKAKTARKHSYVAQRYIDDITSKNETRNSSQELANLFIWSGINYYIRQITDSYIVFSPVKYFKNIHLINKKCLGGFLFNREYFHASASAISAMYWSGEEDLSCERWDVEAFDIQNDIVIPTGKIVSIKKVYNPISMLAKNIKENMDVDTNVVCNSDGTPELYIRVKGRQPVYNDNIIGYLYTNAFPINAINRMLVRCNWKPGQMKAMGCHLRRNEYLQKLPLWVTKMYPQDEWYEKEVYYSTSDGGDAYTHDPQFLKSCLIYTCLSNQNKCLSFDGSDGRRYQNELCFDDSNVLTDSADIDKLPLALKDLRKFAEDKKTSLDDDEKELLALWNKIMEEARQTKGYNPDFNYGVYQITRELNTFHIEGNGRSKKKVYDYPVLNGDLDTLRVMLKAYYKSHITEKMFKYELLK